MHGFNHILHTVILLFISLSAGAVDIDTCTHGNKAVSSDKSLTLTYSKISNSDDKTRISFEITCDDAPFTIYRVEWINCDSIVKPLEPFSLIADDRSTVWNISIDFPFSERFDDSDRLVLVTDRGIVSCPTSAAGELKESIDMMTVEYEQKLDNLRHRTHIAWCGLAVILVIVLVTFLILRERMKRRHKELEEMTVLIAEGKQRNKELEQKVNELYGRRLDTLNMLCNQYFDKNDTDKMKLLLFKDVENHILGLRDRKSINELEEIVNTYQDGIIRKLREQLPELSRKDLDFLTYLYAGFSPRAVCIFTDIKIKNFYNRRSRLKERIMASEATDRDLFVSGL